MELCSIGSHQTAACSCLLDMEHCLERVAAGFIARPDDKKNTLKVYRVFLLDNLESNGGIPFE